MNWITLLQITGFLFLVLLGAAGYLLCVASGRASEREARVAEILRNAKTRQRPWFQQGRRALGGAHHSSGAE